MTANGLFYLYSLQLSTVNNNSPDPTAQKGELIKASKLIRTAKTRMLVGGFQSVILETGRLM